MTEHIIQPGQTLNQIAKLYGVSLQSLQDANNIKNPNLIFTGQSIKIPIESDKAFNIRGLSVEKQNQTKDFKLGGSSDVGVHPLYAYYPPVNTSPGITTPQIPIPIYSTPQISTPIISTPITVTPKNPVKARACAKDVELLKRYGASQIVNDPDARAQFVVGDEDGEVSVTGNDLSKPDTITIKDNTNGKVNTYNYRRLTKEEVKAGKTKDGIPLTKGAYKDENAAYYILVSAEDKDGNLRIYKNAEVYKLDYTPPKDKNDVHNYNLIQTKGMDGSNNSSMDYDIRKKRK